MPKKKLNKFPFLVSENENRYCFQGYWKHFFFGRDLRTKGFGLIPPSTLLGWKQKALDRIKSRKNKAIEENCFEETFMKINGNWTPWMNGCTLFKWSEKLTFWFSSYGRKIKLLKSREKELLMNKIWVHDVFNNCSLHIKHGISELFIIYGLKRKGEPLESELVEWVTAWN